MFGGLGIPGGKMAADPGHYTPAIGVGIEIPFTKRMNIFFWYVFASSACMTKLKIVFLCFVFQT